MKIEVGDTSVILSLTVTKNGGVIGLSPTVSIRRISDGQFLDFGTSTFQAAFVDTTMTEVDAANLPGVYEVVWDSSQEITSDGDYVATYTVSEPNAKLTVSETISFFVKEEHELEVEDIRKILFNRKLYDSIASKLTVYDDDNTTPIREFNTKGADGNPSGLSPIFEVIPI